jgi:hypothetical protein
MSMGLHEVYLTLDGIKSLNVCQLFDIVFRNRECDKKLDGEHGEVNESDEVSCKQLGTGSGVAE